MAIDRTAFNALVEGSSGTIWDKAAIAGVLLDPIDAAIASSIQTTTNTGNQADFNLSSSFTYLRCTGAAPVFGGFQINGAAPASGDRVILSCLGTTARVLHQDTSFESVAVNRVICPSTNGQIIGVNGRMDLVYDGTTSRWRAHCIDPGTPLDVTFAAGDYTGNGSMTWTVASGDVEVFRYQQMGQRLKIEAMLFTTTVGGTPSTVLQIAIPAGFTALVNGSGRSVFRPAYVSDNGTETFGYVTCSSTKIQFVKAPAANWTASTDNTRVAADLMIMVN